MEWKISVDLKNKEVSFSPVPGQETPRGERDMVLSILNHDMDEFEKPTWGQIGKAHMGIDGWKVKGITLPEAIAQSAAQRPCLQRGFDTILFDRPYNWFTSTVIESFRKGVKHSKAYSMPAREPRVSKYYNCRMHPRAARRYAEANNMSVAELKGHIISSLDRMQRDNFGHIRLSMFEPQEHALAMDYLLDIRAGEIRLSEYAAAIDGKDVVILNNVDNGLYDMTMLKKMFNPKSVTQVSLFNVWF